MLLFYMDESGTGLKDTRTPFFVLTAVAIPAEKWQSMDSQIVSLKRRMVGWAKPEDFEIKGRDLRRGEKFFKNLDWQARVSAFHDVAQLIAELPCKVFAVQVDKRDLPDYIDSDTDLYRLAFWRLLDELETELTHLDRPRMLMVDMRSDMHSSVQDRRLVDAYREWIGSRMGQTHLIELPWFGYSAFYAGLELADFAVYLVDSASNEETQEKRRSELREALERFRSKVQIVHIP